MSVRQQLGMGVESLEQVRTVLGMPRPASLRDLLARYALPVEFDAPLITPDGVPLGGHHSIRLERNGTYRYTGTVNASGFPSYDYGVRVTIGAESGSPAIVAASGHVSGTNETGDRKSSWDKSDTNNLLALRWIDFKNAQFNVEFIRDADLFGDIGDVLTFVGELIGGWAVSGASGVCIMLGIDAADATGIDEQVGIGGLVGVGVAAGTLVIFGQGAIVGALVAGAAAGIAVELALKHRQLTDAEFEFADKVFHGTLPRHRIVLTNMLGFERRPFTIPSLGDTILVNLGLGFDNPMTYPGFGDTDERIVLQAPGQLFIHELTHAWQIDKGRFLPAWMCEELGALAKGKSGYVYGPAGGSFGDFNPEQQARMVDDWFAGSGRQLFDAANKLMGPMVEDDRNPYFRYIRDNIRAGLTE